ncbi:MAG TPA: S8 family serine peptidase [Saprospiraceae bacterium]|nr:S8 family serine peptidase [Saprospiraceae bacterium]
MRAMWKLMMICMFQSSLLIGQASDTSEIEYFVHLKADIPLDTITAYLLDQNSTQIWYHSSSGLALWSVNNYPFTTGDGTQVTDINTIIRQSRKKTQVQEAGLDYFTVLADQPGTVVNTCFDPLDYSVSQGNNLVKIAILDTGIKPNIQNNSTPTLNYNLTSYTGYDYVNNDLSPDDEHGHGSHIAGIIHSITHGVSTSGNNIQFIIQKTHDADGKGKLSNIVKALLDATGNDANIVNMSFGIPDTLDKKRFYPLKVAIDYAKSKDVLVVAAAGNNNMDIDNLNETALPASFGSTNIVSVGALSCSDAIANFSNYGGLNMDIAILGEDIPGPDLTTTGIDYASGTSQATAIISAMAALVKTKINANEDISVTKCGLLSGVDSLFVLQNKCISGGKANINGAVSKVANLNQTYTVTNTGDYAPGSLRYALTKACGHDRIEFSFALNGSALGPFSKPLLVDGDMRIDGNPFTPTVINVGNEGLFIIGHSGNLEGGDLRLINVPKLAPTLINHGNFIVKNLIKFE